MIQLTEENYYRDKTYLSNSRLKKYLECEAKALAIDSDKWQETRDDTPLLLGNYVHSYFENAEAHRKFLEKNSDRLLAKTGKNKGQLKSEFLQGDKMIECLKTDELFLKLYDGFEGENVQKEMIVFGEIEGVPVKGKLDSVNLNRRYFVDLKTMKSLYAEEWNKDLKKRVPAAVNNILNFKYHGQLGLYRELLRQMTGETFRPMIVGVSKEDIPDKDVFTIDEEWLDEGLQDIRDNIKRVWSVIQKETAPSACGRCDYCRSKKKLDRMHSLNDLIGE